jgi:hypothetical protein
MTDRKIKNLAALLAALVGRGGLKGAGSIYST